MLKNINSIFILCVFTMLSLPIISIAFNNDNAVNLSNSLLGTLGVTLLIYLVFLFFSEINIYLARVLTIALLFFFFLIRLTLGFVYDFSGRGFTNEFLAHFSMKSFLVGFDQYKILFLIAIILAVLMVYYLIKILIKKSKFSLLLFSVVLFSSATLILSNLNSIPEWNLLNAYSRYYTVIVENREISIVRSEAKKILLPLRGTNKLPVEKYQIEAKTSNNPKNVIIIYLESFSAMLTENSNYPELTPNLDRLKNQYTSFSNNYSSAYVTIEGIANSQCGTLLNMDNGNNSLTSAGGRVPNLPCLGDILQKAGYKQIFYGGADLAFAGKGAFLVEHGYDETLGTKDWRSKGFKDTNTWGLSDSDLFNQALTKVLELKKEKRPFNLTLLTLGTHLPGFSYEGCSKYTNLKQDNKFLDAIHCTDFLIGRFIQQLIDHNLLSDTVVYIQGDHAVFPTREMKKLFSDKHKDRRVLNIVLDDSNDFLNIDYEKPTTSLNMVANILDLLDIEHNVDFVLARSDFKKSMDKQYVITRYHDYYGNDIIESHIKKTNCNNNSEISIPLNYCDKAQALKSLNRLIASYSHQQLDQQVCTLGATIYVDDDSNKINVRWGNTNLSQQFYHEGRTFSNTRKGFYLLLLDDDDQVINRLFYYDNEIEIKKLNNQLIKEGVRYLLFSNLSSEQLSSLKIQSLNKSFSKNKIQYSKVVVGNTVSLFDKAEHLENLTFIPSSCTGDIAKVELVDSPKIKNIPSCQVINWGPRQTVHGTKFQEQPDGSSAFWLKTNCIEKDVVIRINETKLRTVVRLPVITAAIEDALYLKEPGLYQLDLYHPASNTSIMFGEFKVIPDNQTPLYLPLTTLLEKTSTPPILLAHAGGGYKSQPYTNSLDALNHNYSLGHRVFEIDFNWTSDYQLVGIHDWGKTYERLFNQHTKKAPDLKFFKSLKMKNDQTQLTLLNLDHWLSQHPDAYIVTDVRGENIKALNLMARQMKNALRQVIPQMYHPTNYESIMDIGYNDIILTLYATKLSTNKIIEFVNNNRLYAVTINPSKEGFNKIVKALSEINVFTYVHTFNTIAELKTYLSEGVDGIYTDFLYFDKKNKVIKQN